MSRNDDLFAQFEGCLVSITDDEGNEIGQGTLDRHGMVRGVIDGVEYTQQLTHLTTGDD